MSSAGVESLGSTPQRWVSGDASVTQEFQPVRMRVAVQEFGRTFSHPLRAVAPGVAVMVEKEPQQVEIPVPDFRHGSKTGTGTSPAPVFWVVVEGWLGGESPFLNHAVFWERLEYSMPSCQ